MSVFEFLWNMRQENDLDDLHDQARRDSLTASQSAAALKRLSAENEELWVCVSALSELLVARGVISADELKAAVATKREETISAKAVERARRNRRGPNQKL